MVNMLDSKMQRPARKDIPREHDSIALTEPESAPAIPLKTEPAPAAVGSIVCSDCRHLYCEICENGSAAKQYSDFWICHRCSELNRRARNLEFKGLPDEFGKD